MVAESDTEEIMSIKVWLVIIETLWDQSPPVWVTRWECICHLMMGRWCLSVSLVSTSLCADCQHLIVCNFRRGRGCTVSSTHIFSLEESFCHHVKIYLAEKQQEFTTGRGTLCCNSDLWQFLLMYHDVFIVLTLHVGYQQFVRKYYFCYLSNLCNYSPQSWASPIGSGHKIVLLQLNY